MRKHILAPLTAVLLSGCSFIPDYSRPDFPVEQQWPQGPAYEAATGDTQAVSASDIGWEEFFKSPQLKELIKISLENNRDLRIAALNIEAARALYGIQRSAYVPSIDVVGAGTRQKLPENASETGQDTIQSQYSVNLGTTAYEIDLFGRVRSLGRTALEQYLATEAAKRATQVALIAEVANTYLQLLADQKLLSLTEETLAAQEKSLDVIQKSFDLGIGTRLDVSQAQTSVETARANKAQYLRQVAQDKNALNLLAGATLNPDLFENASLDQELIADTIPVGLPSEVLLQRPDIRQAEHQLLAANANIGAARAAFFPTITLTGGAGLASQSLSDLFASGSGLAWSFLPQITVPIFSGGFNMANLRVSETQREIAVAEYERSIQIAFREVADELAALGTLDEQLAAQTALVQATSNSYELSSARYDQGIDSYLNVLDAQRSLYSAQQGQIVIQQQRISNLVTLYKVLGGGVDRLDKR